MPVYGSGELNELAMQLLAVHEWLTEQPARHALDMADVVDKAYRVIDDLYDEVTAAEKRAPCQSLGGTL